MAEELTDTEKRKLGIDLFNETWTYLDRHERTAEDDDRMLERAYASAYYWSQVGKPENFARSHWQLSRVWAVLGQAQPALYHARRCLDYCEANDIYGWDRPFAYEAFARAYAAAGDAAETLRYLALAREHGERIEEKGDRDHFFSELATVVPPDQSEAMPTRSSASSARA
jgi:hypothetical protein